MGKAIRRRAGANRLTARMVDVIRDEGRYVDGLGLDHNETRSWHGWHRHVSLVMLAFAKMAVIRYRANDVPPPKRSRVRTIRI